MGFSLDEHLQWYWQGKHILDWVSWGEKRAKSIHTRFNTLQRMYHSAQDPVKRLLLIAY